MEVLLAAECRMSINTLQSRLGIRAQVHRSPLLLTPNYRLVLLQRRSTIMSSQSPVASYCGLFSFCGLLKSILVKKSRPSVLLPILRLVEQASPAFPPLQSAAGGLLNVIELIEVWNRFSL